MKYIVGLGNPGKKYEKNRHNVGFLFLDFLTEMFDFSDWKKGRAGEFISTGNIQGKEITLIRPMTFMNLSGEPFSSYLNYYKIPLEDTITIYDDIDMDFGKIRVREKGSSGGHNGIRSIQKHLGENFLRIKVGVGRHAKMPVDAWVLSDFSKEEFSQLSSDVFEKILDTLLADFL